MVLLLLLLLLRLLLLLLLRSGSLPRGAGSPASTGAGREGADLLAFPSGPGWCEGNRVHPGAISSQPGHGEGASSVMTLVHATSRSLFWERGPPLRENHRHGGERIRGFHTRHRQKARGVVAIPWYQPARGQWSQEMRWISWPNMATDIDLMAY